MFRAGVSSVQVVCVALGLAAVAMLPGQAKAVELSIGPRVSYFDPKDADNGEWSGGGQVRLHFTDIWGVEGSVDYHREEFEQTDTTVHTYPVQLSLLATLMPGNAVRPFLLGGAGWYYTSVDGPGNADGTDHRFGTHLGAGLEFALNESWSIDGTYRYIWLENLRTQDAALLDKEFNDSGSQFTAGLNYHFH